MAITQYLIADPTTGIVRGLGATADLTFPLNTYACTDAQAAVWLGSRIVDGMIEAGAPPALTPSQLASAALLAGIALTSPTHPTLNGTYSCDDTAQSRLNAISTYVLVNSMFPGNVATYPWLDVTGTPHVLPSVEVYQQFATAIANYVAALDIILLTNAGSLPAATVTVS